MAWLPDHPSLLALQKENLLLREENERLRSEANKWVDLCMKGEATREKVMLDLILNAPNRKDAP